LQVTQLVTLQAKQVPLEAREKPVEHPVQMEELA
jgi:hypothetical protein